MSSAIDFNLIAVRMQLSPWQIGAKERWSGPADDTEKISDVCRQRLAQTATDEDEPYTIDKTVFCCFMTEYGPSRGKTLNGGVCVHCCCAWSS